MDYHGHIVGPGLTAAHDTSSAQGIGCRDSLTREKPQTCILEMSQTLQPSQIAGVQNHREKPQAPTLRR